MLRDIFERILGQEKENKISYPILPGYKDPNKIAGGHLQYVLDELLAGRGVSSKTFYAARGAFRLANYIHRLRRDYGFPIYNVEKLTCDGKTYVQYRMEKLK